MKNDYQIEGMSCGGCVNSVKHALQQINGVEDVVVHLKPPTATITMHHPVDTEVLQARLSKAGNYSIRVS